MLPSRSSPPLLRSTANLPPPRSVIQLPEMLQLQSRLLTTSTANSLLSGPRLTSAGLTSSISRLVWVTVTVSLLSPAVNTISPLRGALPLFSAAAKRNPPRSEIQSGPMLNVYSRLVARFILNSEASPPRAISVGLMLNISSFSCTTLAVALQSYPSALNVIRHSRSFATVCGCTFTV